jgi:hypothetical protein
VTGSFSPEQLAQYKTFLGFFTSEQRIQVAELLMVEDDINLLWMEDWLKEFVGSIAEQDRSKSPSSTRSEALR